MDDFGVKYFSQDDANHLLNALRQNYEVTVDRKGLNYCGLSLRWDYDNGTVDISMPGYIDNLLHKVGRPTPKRYNYVPHPYTQPVYGKQQQLSKPPDTRPQLNGKETLKFYWIFPTDRFSEVEYFY